MRARRARAVAVMALGLALASRAAGMPGIIELRDDKTRIDVLPFSLIALEKGPSDAPSRLSFHPDLSRFAPGDEDISHGYFDAKAVWLCFTVRSAASARSWLLDAGPNRGELVSLYAVDSDGSVESQILDPAQRSDLGIRPPTEYAFRLTIGPGQVRTVYMRFESEGLWNVRASIWDSYEYIKTDELESSIEGIILGVILAVFIYTLFIAISLRESSYILYLAYLFAFLASVVAASGAGQARGRA